MIQKNCSQILKFQKVQTLKRTGIKAVGRDLLRAYPDVDYLDDMDLIESMQDVYEEEKCPFIVIIDEWDCIFREFRQDREACIVHALL